MELWSNPTPSSANSATLSAPYVVHAADIGQLVHSILQYREQQQQQQQKAYSDIAKGVAGAYGSYQQGQSANSANDAANAAIYGSQYPNDPYGGYSNPDVVPDYGGTSALAGIGAERKLNPEAFMSDYERQLMDAKINAEQALAHNRWTYPNNSGDGSDIMDQVHAQSIANSVRKNQLDAASQQIAGDVGYDDLPTVVNAMSQYRAGQTKFPLMQGDKTPGALKDKLISDLGAYQQALKGGSSPISAPIGAAPGVRQESIDQVKQAAPDVPPISPQQPTTAPGYGNKAVMMKAPDGTVSPVDPDLVDYYKKKGAVVVVQ